MEHCRCHIVYVNKTRAERIAYTVEFPPEHNKIPGILYQEAETNVALYLIEDIYNPYPTDTFESIGADKLQAISKLADIFRKKSTPQKATHKEIVLMRREVKHNNPTMTTKYTRVKIPSNLPTSETETKKNPK